MAKKNIEKAREALKKLHPEDSALKTCDELYMANRYLTSNPKREELAKALGLPSKCSFCKRKCGQPDERHEFSANCRYGMIQWLRGARR